MNRARAGQRDLGRRLRIEREHRNADVRVLRNGRRRLHRSGDARSKRIIHCPRRAEDCDVHRRALGQLHGARTLRGDRDPALGPQCRRTPHADERKPGVRQEQRRHVLGRDVDRHARSLDGNGAHAEQPAHHERHSTVGTSRRETNGDFGGRPTVLRVRRERLRGVIPGAVHHVPSAARPLGNHDLHRSVRPTARTGGGIGVLQRGLRSVAVASGSSQRDGVRGQPCLVTGLYYQANLHGKPGHQNHHRQRDNHPDCGHGTRSPVMYTLRRHRNPPTNFA